MRPRFDRYVPPSTERSSLPEPPGGTDAHATPPPVNDQKTAAPPIAVVGAGAIADIFHLPALARRPDLRPHVVVVDRDAGRAREIAQKHGFARHASDFREVLPEVRGAIIAVPHHLHFPMSRECVAAGVHVLCEKPVAESPEEIDVLEAEAGRHGVTVSVNNTRRLYPSTRAVKETLDAGRLGEVRRIDFEEGGAFEWPAVGEGYFGAAAGGHGVLFDVGAHVLDLVAWWLDGTPEVVDYADDAAGGTEAVAEIRLRKGACEAWVKLSWLSKLKNRYRITGSNGYVIEHGIYDWRSPTMIAPDGRRSTMKTPSGPATYPGFADVLIESFVDVITGRADPLIPASSVRSGVGLIAECYARRRPLPAPWNAPIGGVA